MWGGGSRVVRACHVHTERGMETRMGNSASITRNSIVGLGICGSLLLAGCANSTSSTSSSSASPTCMRMDDKQAQAAFDRWNASLATGNPDTVVSNYAPGAVLLPTLSNVPRDTPAEMRDYFEHFLQKGPQGKIDYRVLRSACDMAVDTGDYTFTFKDGTSAAARFTFVYSYVNGEWKIISHHSSLAPDKA